MYIYFYNTTGLKKFELKIIIFIKHLHKNEFNLYANVQNKYIYKFVKCYEIDKNNINTLEVIVMNNNMFKLNNHHRSLASQLCTIII